MDNTAIAVLLKCYVGWCYFNSSNMMTCILWPYSYSSNIFNGIKMIEDI